MSEVIVEDIIKSNKEIEESLKYASYIQRAMFPAENDIKQHFKDSFLIYMPKDIVSGDFYWFHRDMDKIILAVGDSTGHGVPGAFLSILGVSFLQLVISKYSPRTPSIALNYMREYLMNSLNQTGKETDQKDGIDMSLCFIHNHTNRLQYSGALNSMYIVRKDAIIQLDGDKMPIGVAAEFENSFTSKTLDIFPGDNLYLFSDGYPDQFGGPEGKKFKYRPFRKLLLECSKLEPYHQKEVLVNELNKWKGNLSQLDDITILGIKYP
jgi:serine phosphatase RsbU (regulator of sigma subunit)